MMILEALGATFVFAAAVSALRALISLSSAKLVDDTERLKAALHALVRHRSAMMKIMENESVEPFLKKCLLDLCDVVPSRQAACQLMDWVEAGRPHTWNDAAESKAHEFRRAMAALKQADSALWKEANTALSAGLVAIFLQWPDIRSRLSALEAITENVTAQAPEIAVEMQFSAASSESASRHAFAA